MTSTGVSMRRPAPLLRRQRASVSATTSSRRAVAIHGNAFSVASNERGSLTAVNLLCTQSQPVPSGGT